MDDNRFTPEPHVSEQLPTSVWLTFSLAFVDNVRLCRHIRQACPDPYTAGRLIQRYLDGLQDDLTQALRGLLSERELAVLTSASTRHRRDRAFAWAALSDDHHLLGLDHPAYPQRLKDTDDAPPLLYVRGSLDAFARPLLAVVGSRKASHAALAHTRHLCGELAQAGLGIVSGLALGIDAAAHEGALAGHRHAAGPTLAIAATPPDRVYPRRHAALAERIIDAGGLIATESPLGVATRPWFFPQRNRIISGLSLGVLVTEAALPSGTLTTATHAMNQGRDVLAVPGSVNNLQARGCHHLIKQGAALVEDAHDIVDALGDCVQRELALWRAQQGLPANWKDSPECAAAQSTLELDSFNLSQPERHLLALLTAQSATIDELMTQSSWSVSQLAALLGVLEIRGLITTTSGGRYARC